MESHAITRSVNERYARAVTTGEEMCCPTGYNYEELRAFIPEPVLKVSYGCGTPIGLATVQPGETVLDIGSGGGIDCFEASRRVGASGRVIGLDMTDEMLALAQTHAPTVARNLGYAQSNVEFRKGQAEAMPVEDAAADLIVSNCVINLSPDKDTVFREMFRVLRPGGRFSISDIVTDQPLPQYLIHDREKWGDCLSGALPFHEYRHGLRTAGFVNVHQVTLMPWRMIDGFHFFSVTLAGYKMTWTSECVIPAPPSVIPANAGIQRPTALQFATLKGPFSQVRDELGHTYQRGIPEPLDPRRAALLQMSHYEGLFHFSETPTPLTHDDPRWVAVWPDEADCVWNGDFALLTGPLLEAQDDDGHTFSCDTPPVEICSKTRKVLDHALYAPYFGTFNRAGGHVSTEAESCQPSGGCC